MASTYSTLLRVELIGTGDQSGTWGSTTNANLGTVLEDAIAATATIDVTAGNVTLTNLDGVADQARCMILNVIGTPGTSRNIITPKLSKTYVVINGSNGAVVIKDSDITGTTVAAGTKAHVAFNTVANDFVTIVSSTDYVVPGGALGTPSSGTLSNCTVDGTNSVGYRNVPAVGTKTSSYVLATGDVGKYVQIGAGGSITIPNSVFSEGDVVSLFNNTSSNATITCNITTAYISGEDTDKNSVLLATRGIATVLFISSTLCVISGNVA